VDVGAVSPKEKLILTASRLFRKQGYHATGLNQILKESGVPKGSLYHYFPDGKETLAIEAIHHAGESLHRLIESRLSLHDDPITAISVFIDETADEIFNQEMIIPSSVSLLALETASLSEPLRAACEACFRDWESLYARKLSSHGMSEDAAKKRGALIELMIEGALITALTKQDRESLHLVADAVRRLGIT